MATPLVTKEVTPGPSQNKRSRVVKQIQFDEIDGANNNARPATSFKKAELQAASKQLLTQGDGIDVSLIDEDDVDLDYVDDLNHDDSSCSMDIQEDNQIATEVTTSDNNQEQDADMDLSEMMANPKLKRMFDRMWDERMKEVQVQGESSGSLAITTPTQQNPNAGMGN